MRSIKLVNMLHILSLLLIRQTSGGSRKWKYDIFTCAPLPTSIMLYAVCKMICFDCISSLITSLSGSIGIPYNPPYAVLVGLKFDLGVLQGVWRGVVGGRGGEGVLVAVPVSLASRDPLPMGR